MLVPASDGYYVQTRVKDLIAEVDAWPGEPTDEDIRTLAEKYKDTEAYVRATFRARKWREEARRLREAGKRKWTPRYRWLPEEIELVQRWWRHRTDGQLADMLSEMPCNRERGAVRTPYMVHRLRKRKGLKKKEREENA